MIVDPFLLIRRRAPGVQVLVVPMKATERDQEGPRT